VTVATDVAQRLRDGYAALTQRNFAAAERACRDVLTADPRCVPAHFLVGLAAVERNDPKTAISAFGSVTRLQHDHVAAWAQLARLWFVVGHPTQAEVALRRALALGSDDPVVQDALGGALTLWGDHAAARAWFERATAARPGAAQFQLNAASTLVALGELERAGAAIDAARAADPANPRVHWMLANTRRATSTEHIRQMEALQERLGARPDAIALLAYAAGKEWEDLEQWDAAFREFERGAAAKRSTLAYDEAAQEAQFGAIVETFSPQWCAARRSGCTDAAPIFIVGQPRSGTTLVERIITSHSQVHSAGELPHFGVAVRRLAGAVTTDAAAVARASANVETKALGEAYLRAVAHLRGGRPRFVDKLPLNYLHVGLIAKALPNARIVHVTRDPCDSCFATYKQLFADAYPHSYDQLEMARHYARYRRLMDHWRAVLPDRVFDVAYEDTVGDVESVARRLIDHLDLPLESACVDFRRNAAPVATASAVQVREAPYRTSIGRWRRYLVQLAPMLAALHEAHLA
jgi:tetratricopeptide (TPR) repeat protein